MLDDLPHNHIGGKRRQEAEESPESLPEKSLSPFFFFPILEEEEKERRLVGWSGRSESGGWVGFKKFNKRWVFDTCSSCSESRDTCGCFGDAIITMCPYVLRPFQVERRITSNICLPHNCFSLIRRDLQDIFSKT